MALDSRELEPLLVATDHFEVPMLLNGNGTITVPDVGPGKKTMTMTTAWKMDWDQR